MACKNPVAAMVVSGVTEGPVAGFLKANGGPGYKAKRGEDTIPWSIAVELFESIADLAFEHGVRFSGSEIGTEK